MFRPQIRLGWLFAGRRMSLADWASHGLGTTGQGNKWAGLGWVWAGRVLGWTGHKLEMR